MSYCKPPTLSNTKPPSCILYFKGFHRGFDSYIRYSGVVTRSDDCMIIMGKRFHNNTFDWICIFKHIFSQMYNNCFNVSKSNWRSFMVILMFMLFAFSVMHKVQFILLHRSSFSVLLSLQDFRDNNFYLDLPY